MSEKTVQDRLLGSPEVLAVKTKWDKNSGYRKKQAPKKFEEVLDLFKSKIGFAEIAKELGVTSQVISAMYRKYFKKLLGGLTGKEYRDRDSRLQDVLEKKSYSLFSEIRAKAEGAGCQTSTIMRYGNLQHPKLILINKHKCLLKRLSWISTHIGSRSSCTSLKHGDLLDVTAVIFYVDIMSSGYSELDKLIFIVPSETLLRRYFTKINTRRKNIFVPIDKIYREKGPKRRLDWVQFEGRWDILKSKSE